MLSEKVLKVVINENINVHMSDYGEHKVRIKELVRALQDWEIAYYIHKYEEWHGVGDLQKRNYPDKVKKELCSMCTMV